MAKKPPEPPEPISDQHPTLNSPGHASTAPISGEERVLAEAKTLRIADGEVVGGRYRIVRYIARGGMGEVYEAEDLELAERVALKTIRSGTRDRAAEERFKREIQLSRKVTHPNVCRIFDVGYHMREGGDTLVFLTMEFLNGETLIDRVRRSPIPIAEAGALLRQISAGLSAAHAAGVVHRDLKSNNVILVPRKGGSVRAVVTDFGLAHLLGGGEDRARSLSGSGGIVGTPGYMAPEQVENGELSARTDLYALGVVMYEMVTGQLPFDGATPLSIAAKRLTTPAPSPKKLRPDLPGRWEKAVLACLERDPKDRPATARAVAELVGLVTDSLEELDGTVPIARMGRRWPLLWPAIALMVVALSLVGVQRWRDRPVTATRRAIAAVPFHPSDDFTAENPWIGEFAAELLAIRLGEGTSLQSFDLSAVTSTLRDIGVSPGAELQATEMERFRTVLTLDLVVTGRYHMVPADGSIVIEAELRDARSQRALTEVRETGGPEEMPVLVGHVADRIARAAGVPAGAIGRGLVVTLPKSPAALRAFVEAREEYDRREVAEAARIARSGLVEEPEHPRLRLLLAESLAELGEDGHAAAEAKIAAQNAGNLPRLERLFVEAAAAGLAHDRPAAILRYETLRKEVPNDPEVEWRLIELLVHAGRSNDALKLIEGIRRDRIPKILGIRLDLLEVEAREAQGDLDRALTVAQDAAKSADDLGARLARANARFKECHVLYTMHRLDEARTACEAAKRTAGEAGNRHLRATTINSLANIDYAAGNLDAARQGYDQILPLFRELGDRSGESATLNNLANVAFDNLDRNTAIKLWRQSVALNDEYQDATSSAPTLENLGSAYYSLLDWSQAISFQEKAVAIWRTADEPDSLLRSSCSLASLYLTAGRGADTERTIAALDAVQARLTGAPDADLECDSVRADLEAGHGHPERAVGILRAAAARVKEHHEEIARVTVAIELAGLQAEVGELRAAMTTIDTDATHAAARTDLAMIRAAKALHLRLEAQLGAVERGPARVRELEDDLKTEPSRLMVLLTTLQIERARAALGDRKKAITQLQALAKNAFERGAVSVGLEAQLRQAELDTEHPLSKTFVADYSKRARLADRQGWADKMESIADNRAR